MILRLLLPLAVFALIGALLFTGLGRDPDLVPSPLIGKPMPAFTLPRLHSPEDRVAHGDLTGNGPFLINVWGSWCYACRVEHDALTRLAQTGRAPIYGLNYKDRREDALRWLGQFGDPWALHMHDPEGRVSMDFGVYGAPETYVIDAGGIIRFKHIGPLTDEIVDEQILPLVEELKEGEA
jgi:cytochrome c biogenesis protein CcmG/thiol:disulfide interchange protein DsbE